jgi:GtrA-like protein
LTRAESFLGRSLPEAGRFGRYLIVGAAANLFGLAIYYLATLAIGVEPKRALTLASAIAFVPAYAANRAWTFRSNAGTARSLLRYGAGYAASFLLQVAILHLGVDRGWCCSGSASRRSSSSCCSGSGCFRRRRPAGCDKPSRHAL